MNLENDHVDPELRALLERSRGIQRVPDVVRARALSRARAVVAAGAAVAPVQAVAAGGMRWLRIAVAAAVVVAVAAVGAAAALHWRAPERRVDASAPAAPPSRREAAPGQGQSVQEDESVHEDEPVQEAPAATLAKSPRTARSPTAAQESYAAELELLQRAQTAYAGGDFAGTLGLLAKHGHRFPNGRLAEEREALRVRSLAGSGKADDARRAVAAFARRFPRSVLLPRLQETANAAE